MGDTSCAAGAPLDGRNPCKRCGAGPRDGCPYARAADGEIADRVREWWHTGETDAALVFALKSIMNRPSQTQIVWRAQAGPEGEEHRHG